jgi:hypothetical protein
VDSRFPISCGILSNEHSLKYFAKHTDFSTRFVDYFSCVCEDIRHRYVDWKPSLEYGSFDIHCGFCYRIPNVSIDL